MTLLLGLEVNQGKRSAAVDLHRTEGREVLDRMVSQTDVVLYSKLPAQAERLGVAPNQVHALNERAIVTAVTAYGGAVPGAGWEDRPAYDPVIQALSGIMRRFGGDGDPAIHGIASCIDYFTGFGAAFGSLVALVAREHGARKLVARTSLARTAGWVQLPFVGAPGAQEPRGLDAVGPHALDRIYRTKDGWMHFGALHADWPAIRDAAGHSAPAEPSDAAAWLGAQLRRRTTADAVIWVRTLGAAGHEVANASRLRDSSLDGDWPGTPLDPALPSGRVLAVEHPANERYWVPDATWIRPRHATRHRLGVAPRPGQNTRAVLTDIGYDKDAIDQLLSTGVAATGWPSTQRYVPE